MSNGLKGFVEKILENPENTTLINRYLVLISELESESEKTDHVLELAESLVGTNSKQSLRLALMVVKADHYNVRALGISAKCMRVKGRLGKAEIIQNEIDKIAKIQANGMSSLNFTKGRQDFSINFDSAPVVAVDPTNAVGRTPPYEGGTMLELKAAFEYRDPSQQSAPIHQINLEGLLPDNTVKLDQTFNLEGASDIGLSAETSVEEAPKTSPLLDAPEWAEASEAGLSLTLGDDSPASAREENSPLGHDHTFEPGSAFSVDLGSETPAPIEPTQSFSKALADQTFGGSDDQVSLDPVQPISMDSFSDQTFQMEPVENPLMDSVSVSKPETKSIPIQKVAAVPLDVHSSEQGSFVEDEFAVIAELFDFYFSQNLISEASDLLMKSATLASTQTWWRVRRTVLDEKKRNPSGATLASKKQDAGAPVVTREAVGNPLAVASSDQWKGLNTSEWAEFLDKMIGAGNYRESLHLVKKRLDLSQDIEDAKAAYRRLPNIWQALRIKGFTWNEVEGAAVFCTKLGKKTLPRLSSFVPVEK